MENDEKGVRIRFGIGFGMSNKRGRRPSTPFNSSAKFNRYEFDDFMFMKEKKVVLDYDVDDVSIDECLLEY